MTKRKAANDTKGMASEPSFPPPVAEMIGDINKDTTGRYIVIFKKKAASTNLMHQSLAEIGGLKNVARSSAFTNGAVSADDIKDNHGVIFENLGMAVVSGDAAAQSLSLSLTDSDSPILSIEPEYISYLSPSSGKDFSSDYIRGYKDAVNHLFDQLMGEEALGQEEADTSTIFQDTAQYTWGLQATHTHTSSRSGKGIKVAILDTGFDFQHPDFIGRPIISETFTGFPVQDIFGHGTHCAGTACGPQRPVSGVRRYGVAYGAQLYIGKVFNNDPRPGAPTSSVLAGIEWAITNGCIIVSLSLGSPRDQKTLQYEVPIQRALDAGTIVVAAAGNNADRPQFAGFVEPPANADAAMAVAALDNHLQIASFSGRSSLVTGAGGSVNIAGPGVAVFSSVPVIKGNHALFNGTSMATPHVAGIAALWAEATGEKGSALWSRLIQSALPLNLLSVDVGAGLAQSP